jgi:23S rRNA (uridine2552-2'-O)-methyltransferase
LKKNQATKNWLIKQRKDSFFKLSKIKGYKSRSAFKLIELDNKFKFLQNSSFLLDLGSSPGGWSQVASKKITKGKILGVDIKNMEKIKNVDFIQGDFQDINIHNKIMLYFDNKVDVVLSDMAMNTSGNKALDSFRTGELCINAMDIAVKILDKEGVFVSKLFMGSIFKEIQEKAKKTFKKVIKFKPLSSKKESKEIYIYCRGISNSFN